jgi:hypothetical protein
VKGGIRMKEKKIKKSDLEAETLVEPEEEAPKKAKKEKPVKVKKVDVAKENKKRQKFTSKYFKKFSGRSDLSYGDMLQADYKAAMKRAELLSSLKPGDYDSPIIITVPDAYNKGGKVTYRLDKKSDGSQTLLYDQALVTILFFGADSLFYYQANVDHRNGHIGYDVAGEFNYFDVVHMETSLKYDHPDRPKYITLDLEVGLSDGVIVPFHLRNHRIHDDYELPGLITENEQKVLDTIKEKVRNSRMV